uniref:DnaJ-like protein C11 C-terminal domain-containing protein n=1 Tax=Romanomermis culicivorax TaxID=13658 RepID=A0A915JZS7_ROMCU
MDFKFFVLLEGISKQLDKHLVGIISTGFNVDLENLSNLESLLPTLYVNSALTYDDETSKRIIGSVKVGADESHFQLSTLYRFRDENDSKLKLVFEVGTTGALGQIGFERKISEQNTFGCSCLVHWPQCSLSLKLRLKRANQTFSLNFLICDEELYTKAIFYGIVLPAAIYNASKWCYRVYMQKMGQKLHLESLERGKLEIEIKKKEASTTIQLMTPYASRIKENEEKLNGLIILDAKYGSNDQNAIDVTIPLQAMVKDSRLILQNSSKACLAGFYDPCPDIDKILTINYRFNESYFYVRIKDEEGLDLPNTSHKIVDEPEISSPKIDSSGFVDDSFTARGQQSLYED